MASISSALNSATTGLTAAARRADLVANNIANASTPGYARRELSVSERILNGNGAGVDIDGVLRSNDPVLTAETRRAVSNEAFDEAVAGARADFNSALGEPDDPFSLFAQYANFESSLRDLAETPESAPYQNQTLEAARALATTFNRISDKTQDVRQAADRSIEQSVDFINSAVVDIEELNDKIAQLEVGGQDATALRDQRQRLIDQVSEKLPVKEIQREFGRVDLMTDEGVFLLAGEPKQLEFNAFGTFTADLSLSGGQLAALTIDGIDVTPGAGSQSIRQGDIAGQFAIRDTIGPEFQSQIDSLARDVIERFQDIDSTLPAGSAGLFTDGGAVFDPANETGVAGRIAVNAAVDPTQGGQTTRLRDGLGATTEGPSGNADFIRTMLDSLTALRPLSAGGGLNGSFSAAESAAGVASNVGGARILAETSLAASAARATSLEDAHLAATGVDTDAELQKMLEIEQAFQANARVIQAASEMLQRLIDL